MRNIDEALSDLGEEWVYIRSYGNLGDLLIAEATDQYLESRGFRYAIVNPYQGCSYEHNLVHGGGARFTRDWCDVENCIKVLCNENVKRCVILPSSFHDVDELMSHFDARHTLFCRDARSYEYCLSKCPKSHVFLTDDTAMSLKLEKLQEADLNERADGEDEERLQHALRHYLSRQMSRRMFRATVSAGIGGSRKRVAFLLRTDKEKKTALTSPLAYDISLSWYTPARNKYNGNLLLAFSNALKCADVIVSDRLHVCIMAYHSGREVYMVDNTYGKLKGVYEQSLANAEKVHLIQADNLPDDIQKAWKKLNAPLRIFAYQLAGKIRGVMKRMLRK